MTTDGDPFIEEITEAESEKRKKDSGEDEFNVLR